MQRCIACEVRVNLNCSTKVYFTLFYWFKSRTWQCKSNRACAKVTWKPGQQTWRLILRRSAFRTTLDDETLQSTIEMTPGFKPLCILFTQIVNGNVLRQGLLFRDFLWYFFSEPPTQYQETHSTLNEKKGGMALPEIISCSK